MHSLFTVHGSYHSNDRYTIELFHQIILIYWNCEKLFTSFCFFFFVKKKMKKRNWSCKLNSILNVQRTISIRKMINFNVHRNPKINWHFRRNVCGLRLFSSLTLSFAIMRLDNWTRQCPMPRCMIYRLEYGECQRVWENFPIRMRLMTEYKWMRKIFLLVFYILIKFSVYSSKGNGIVKGVLFVIIELGLMSISLNNFLLNWWNPKYANTTSFHSFKEFNNILFYLPLYFLFSTL